MIGYKGFDKNLSCRNMKFEVGITYTTQYGKNKPDYYPDLCSNQGFHYCEKLENVYRFYNKSTSRFFIIDVLGLHKSDGEKSTTTSFRIIKEITDIKDNLELVGKLVKEELDDYVNKKLIRDNKEKDILKDIELKQERALLKIQLRKEIEEENKLKQLEIDKEISKCLNLDQVKLLQINYPLLHVGGSVGLFLHGIRLDRMLNSSHDLDLISPYFMLYDIEKVEFQHNDPKASGNDFDQTFTMTFNDKTTKVDIKIDPKQAYEIIEYEGFKYKVSKLEIIWAAKLKYTQYGQTKHKEDLYEAMKKNIETKIETPIKTDLPF